MLLTPYFKKRDVRMATGHRSSIVFVVGLLLAVGSVTLSRPARGGCRCALRAQPLDVVFVFDATASMGRALRGVKHRIRGMIRVLRQRLPGLRVGLATYRDYTDSARRKGLDLTEKYERAITFLNRVVARRTVAADGHFQLGFDSLGQCARPFGARLEPGARERNQRHDVGGAEARMDALVAGNVDVLLGGRDTAEGALGHGGGRTDEGVDGAVVVGIAVDRAQIDAGHRANGIRDGVDHVLSTAFGNVRYTFDPVHGGQCTGRVRAYRPR